jgi:hypothetical protein
MAPAENLVLYRTAMTRFETKQPDFIENRTARTTQPYIHASNRINFRHKSSFSPDCIMRSIFKEKSLKIFSVLGVVLILLGLVGFIAGGFSFTHEKKVVDLGSLQLEHKKRETVPVSPLLSGLVFLGGVGLVIAGVRSRA